MQPAVTVARLAIGGLLLVAGGLKIGHPVALAAALAGYRLLPSGLVAGVAIVLPFFEVFVGLYLLVGLFTRIVACIAAVMFLIYAGAIGSAIVRHLPVNCGCFGPADVATADWPHVGFDLALAALALFIALCAPGALALDRRWTRS